MALRFLLYVMMALGLTGFLGVAWFATHSPVPVQIVAAAPPPQVVHPRVAILTAARLLHAGALLSPDDLGSREIESPTPEMVTDTPAAREIRARRNGPSQSGSRGTGSWRQCSAARGSRLPRRRA